MALTPNFASKIITSTASITDVVEFHAALREIEASDEGMLYPTIHSYKQVTLGGGSIFPAVAFINGWTLQFTPGNFEMRGGNIDVAINPVAGCYVRQTQSAAYAVTSIGAGGATPEQIAEAVWANLAVKKLLTVSKFLGLK
jgi:hypothetical protein